MSAQERNDAVVQANTKQFEVPTFNKKEIEKIAREALYNFVDLTVFGVFAIGTPVEVNSIEHPEIEPILKNLFEKYDPNKITVVKLNADAGEENQNITVTASDTAVHIKANDYEIIQIIAANTFKPTEGESEGIYPDISFMKSVQEINGVPTTIYALNVAFYMHDENEGE